MRINHVSFSQCLIQFGNLLLTLFSLNSSAVFLSSSPPPPPFFFFFFLLFFSSLNPLAVFFGPSFQSLPFSVDNLFLNSIFFEQFGSLLLTFLSLNCSTIFFWLFFSSRTDSLCFEQFDNLLLTFLSLNFSAIFILDFFSLPSPVRLFSFDSLFFDQFNNLLLTLFFEQFNNLLLTLFFEQFNSLLSTLFSLNNSTLFFWLFSLNNSTVFFWLSFLRKVPQSSNSFDCPFVEIFHNRLFTLLSLNILAVFSNSAARSPEIWSS